jgi:hypothetical protein
LLHKISKLVGADKETLDELENLSLNYIDLSKTYAVQKQTLA